MESRQKYAKNRTSNGKISSNQIKINSKSPQLLLWHKFPHMDWV